MINVPVTSGAVRKDLYAFLQENGFEMTRERHDLIREMMRTHTRCELVKENARAQNAVNALHQVHIMPKVATIIKRVELFQCPACGLDMTMRADGSYVTACGHMSGIAFCYA